MSSSCDAMMLNGSGVAPSDYLPSITPPSWAYQHKYIQGNILQAVYGICRDLNCSPKVLRFRRSFAPSNCPILHLHTHPE